MKAGEPIPLRDVLDPRPTTIETIAPPSRPYEREAAVDGFSFAVHSVGGGPRRRPRFWFKIVAWIFLGWTVLGLLIEAARIAYSLLHT